MRAEDTINPGDLNKGIALRPARISSAVVIVASLALTALFAARLW
jgi:hypothetical protein